jgi:hypothetical protein
MISLARGDQGVRKARKETDPDFGFGRGPLNGRYNAWLRTRLWNELLEDVVARYASPNVGGVTVSGNGRRRLASAEAQCLIRSANPLGDPVGNDPATNEQGDLMKGIERDSLLCESDKRGQRRSGCRRANDRRPRHRGGA